MWLKSSYDDVASGLNFLLIGCKHCNKCVDYEDDYVEK